MDASVPRRSFASRFLRGAGLALVVIMSALVVSTTAEAQDKPSRSRQEQLFQVGAAAFKAHVWQDAIEAFRAGLTYGTNSILVYNLGRAYEESGDLDTAINQFVEYAALGDVTKAERAEALARAARLTAALPGEIAFVPNAAGAVLEIDGQVVALAPDGVMALRPGSHSIRVRGPGLIPLDTTVLVTARKRLVISVEREVELGTLVVDCVALQARVSIDGKLASPPGSQIQTTPSVSFTGLSCAGYRLPTEAEWEYAARAGTTGATYATLDSIAWYSENSDGATHTVAGKAANAWALWDMLGNVSEWCHDEADSYTNNPVTDPTGPDGSFGYRVRRGGSWDNVAWGARAGDRRQSLPGFRTYDGGFRPARSIP